MSLKIDPLLSKNKQNLDRFQSSDDFIARTKTLTNSNHVSFDHKMSDVPS